MVGGPLAVIYGPVLYMLAATVSLSNFKIFYNFLARFVYQKSRNPVWQMVQPPLRQHMAFLESIFGQPATFTPTTTHVLLVAVMIAIIIHSRR